MKRLSLFLMILGLILAGVPLPVAADSDSDDAPIRHGLIIARISSSNGSEFIQLFNDSATDLSFDTLQVEFTNSGSTVRTASWSERTLKSEGFLLIKQGGGSSDSDYYWGASTNIITPNGGRAEITLDDEAVSGLCWWNNADVCLEPIGLTDTATFVSPACASNGVCALADETRFGDWAEAAVEPPDDPDLDPDPEPQLCANLRLSEISTGEQWIELYNNSDFTIQPANLADCVLSVQYGDKLDAAGRPNYRDLTLGDFAGLSTISPYEHFLIYISDTNLSLAKTAKERSILLHDADSDYDEAIYSTQKTDASLANFGADDWRVTYQPTPGAENIYQQYQACEAGKHINEATGNCVKDPEPPVECAEGQYRNPATGRCKKLAEPNVLAECAEGQFRNPLTNRCKKIALEDDLTPCAEGYERNPDTNRCRKIVDEAEARFAVEDYGSSPESGGLWWLVGLGALGLVVGLIIWQFRFELKRLLSGRKAR
jgi:hypothetical protein